LAKNSLGSGRQLPEGWVWTAIGKVTWPVEKVEPGENPDARFTYLDISSIDNRFHRIAEPKTYYGAEAPSRARQLVQANDVLFSTVRTYLQNIALVPDAYNGQIASTGFAVLRGELGLLPKYLFYYTLTNEFLSDLGKLQRGTSYPAVRDGDVRAQPIPLAPFPEQRRIVAAIETYFARLDAGVAALERARANLKRYRAAVLKAACEGRLVPTEAALARAEGRDYEPADQLLARILAERRARWEAENPGKKYKELAQPDMEGLPELPEGWCWTNMASITADGPQNGLYLPQDLYGQGVPILRIDDYQDGWSRMVSELRLVDASEEQIEKYSLAIEDLVINRVNSPSHLGKCLVVTERNIPSLFESNMMRLRLSRSVSTQYVEFYLRSPFGRMQLTKNAKWAVNQASINQKDVGNAPVAMPPFLEQRRIVAEVERQLSVVAALEREVEAALVRAARLRQSILKRAFEGRLVPQDPNDEPAAVLLERIRAAREAPATGGKKRRTRQMPLPMM